MGVPRFQAPKAATGIPRRVVLQQQKHAASVWRACGLVQCGRCRTVRHSDVWRNQGAVHRSGDGADWRLLNGRPRERLRPL